MNFIFFLNFSHILCMLNFIETDWNNTTKWVFIEVQSEVIDDLPFLLIIYKVWIQRIWMNSWIDMLRFSCFWFFQLVLIFVQIFYLLKWICKNFSWLAMLSFYSNKSTKSRMSWRHLAKSLSVVLLPFLLNSFIQLFLLFLRGNEFFWIKTRKTEIEYLQ